MAKIATLFKALVWELCNKFCSYIFSFCKIKGYYYWKYKFYNLCVRDPASRLLQIGYKSEKWQWRRNFPKIHQFFLPCGISLVKFSYWPKFHVNVMTGVTKIFAYKRLTGDLEIVNTPVWVLPSILRLGQARDTKFGPNVSNKMLLDPPKCPGYGFYCFWVIKGKPTGGREVKLLPPSRLVLNNGCWL